MPTYTLTGYRGLQIITPDPEGDGGAAIQDDLVALVEWSPKSVWNATTSPTPGDDENDFFYAGSFWLRTDTTPPQLYVCTYSSTGGDAIWIPLVQTDPAPKLGGNLDVNGHSLVNGVSIGSSSTDPVTLISKNISIPSGLTFTRDAVSSTAEFIQGWKVSDSDSLVSLSNATSNAGEFAPKFLGLQYSNNVALNFTGQSFKDPEHGIDYDNGPNPYVLFAFQNGSTDVATRPGVEFRNRATTRWQMMGDGTVKRFNTSTRESDQMMGSVTTSNATTATAATIAIASGNTYLIEARIVARRTDGSSNDGASYVRRGTYTTKSGTVTLMGSVQTIGTDAEDQAGWDATLDISGTDVRVRVTGAASNDITWFADVSVQRVAS
jgi:hypothetical protein